MNEDVQKDWKKFYLRWLFEQAKNVSNEFDIADENKAYDALMVRFNRVVDDWQKIANETQLKNLQALNQALLSFFECGVGIGTITQHCDFVPMLIKMIKENKELQRKLEDLQKTLPKIETKDLGYIQ